MMLLLFGGRFEHSHTSSTCYWYAWKQHRRGRFYDWFARIMNPDDLG